MQAHFNIYVLISIWRLPGRTPTRPVRPPAALLTYGDPIREPSSGFLLEQPFQGLCYSFSLLLTPRTHFSAMSFGMGTPSTVLQLFSYVLSDPPPPPNSVLQETEHPPPPTPATVSQLLLQLALGEGWPVGGTRGDWREVG